MIPKVEQLNSCLDRHWLMCWHTGLARLELLHELIGGTNWTLEVEPLRLRDVTFSYMQLRNLDMRDTTNKYIVLDLSTADALATVLKQVT